MLLFKIGRSGNSKCYSFGTYYIVFFLSFMLTFPHQIAFGSSGGPSFSNRVVKLKEGGEKRHKYGPARIKYSISKTMLTYNDIQELLSLFYKCEGMVGVFRFRDWTDYKATNQLIATGDGRSNQYSLYRTYKLNKELLYKRRITCPVKETLILYIDGKILARDAYNIDENRGIISLQDALSRGAQLIADFCFDIPMRFDQQCLPITIDSRSRFSINNLELVECDEH